MNAHIRDGSRTPAGHLHEASGKPTARPTASPGRGRRATWVVPAALLLLGAMPVAAGIVRLTQLAGGGPITPANARFFASPLPVVTHIAGAAVYALLGAFQFAARFRRRHPSWHRVAGRLLVPCGLLVGLSALWMTLFYPHPDGVGSLLTALRLLFGSAMVASIILGVSTIRRGDVARHRAWMARAYAIGLGAATQMLTLMIGELVLGPPGELSRALLMGTGWAINLTVAEWAIRRRSVPSTRLAPAVVPRPS